MQYPEGQVLSIDASAEPAHAVVEVAASFSCARCASGKGCGAGLLAGNAEPRRVEALVDRHVDVGVGDRVRLELEADNALRGAALVYGLPLAGALSGAAMAWAGDAGDAVAALAATAGLFVGVGVGRRRLRREGCLRQFTPHVTARLDAS